MLKTNTKPKANEYNTTVNMMLSLCGASRSTTQYRLFSVFYEVVVLELISSVSYLTTVVLVPYPNGTDTKPQYKHKDKDICVVEK